MLETTNHTCLVKPAAVLIIPGSDRNKLGWQVFVQGSTINKNAHIGKEIEIAHISQWSNRPYKQIKDI